MSRSAAGTPKRLGKPVPVLVSPGPGTRHVAFEESAAASIATPLPPVARHDDASPATPLPVGRGLRSRTAFASTPTADAFGSVASSDVVSATRVRAASATRRPDSATRGRDSSTVHPAARPAPVMQAWGEVAPASGVRSGPDLPTPASLRSRRFDLPTPVASNLFPVAEGGSADDDAAADEVALGMMPGVVPYYSPPPVNPADLVRRFAPTPGGRQVTPARGARGHDVADLLHVEDFGSPALAVRSESRSGSRSGARTDESALPPAPDAEALSALARGAATFPTLSANKIYGEMVLLSATLAGVEHNHFRRHTTRDSDAFRFYLSNHAEAGVPHLPTLRINLDGSREDNIEYIGVRKAGSEYNLVIGVRDEREEVTERVIPVRGKADHASWEGDIRVFKALLSYQISRLRGENVRGAKEDYVSTIRQASVREEVRLGRLDDGAAGRVRAIAKIAGSRISPGARSVDFSTRNPLVARPGRSIVSVPAPVPAPDATVGAIFAEAEASVGATADVASRGRAASRDEALTLDAEPPVRRALPVLPDLERGSEGNNSKIVRNQMRSLVGKGGDPFIAYAEAGKTITGFTTEARPIAEGVVGRARTNKGQSKFLMMKVPDRGDGSIDLSAIPFIAGSPLNGKKILGIGVADGSKNMLGGSYSYAVLYEDDGEVKLYEVGSKKRPTAGAEADLNLAQFNEEISKYIEGKLLGKIFTPSLLSLITSVATRSRAGVAMPRIDEDLGPDPYVSADYLIAPSGGTLGSGPVRPRTPWNLGVLPSLTRHGQQGLGGYASPTVASRRGGLLTPLSRRAARRDALGLPPLPPLGVADEDSSADDALPLAGAAAAGSLPGRMRTGYDSDDDAEESSLLLRSGTASGPGAVDAEARGLPRSLSASSLVRGAPPLRGVDDAVSPTASAGAASRVSATGPRRHRPFSAGISRVGVRDAFGPLPFEPRFPFTPLASLTGAAGLTARDPRVDASALRAGEADTGPLLPEADLGIGSASAAAAGTLTAGRPLPSGDDAGEDGAPHHHLATGALHGTVGDDAVATLFDGEADAVLSPTASAGAASRVSATGPRRPPRTAGAIVGDGDRSIFEPLPFGAHPPLSPLASLTGAAGLTARDPRVDASALRAGEADTGPLLPEADLGIGSAGAAAAGTLTAGRPAMVLPSGDAVVGGDGTMPIAVAAILPHHLATGAPLGTPGDDAVATLFGDGGDALAAPPLLPLRAGLDSVSASAAAAATLTAGRPAVVLPLGDTVVAGGGAIPIAVAATPTRPFGAAFRGRDSDEDDDGLELVTMGRGRARSGSDPIGGASARHHPAVPPLRLPPSVGAVAPSPLLPHSRSASIDLGVVGAMTPPPALSLSAGPPIHIPLAPLPTVTSASASGSALPPLPVAPPLSASASGPVLPPPVSAAAPSVTLVQRLAALRLRFARTPAPLAAAAPVSAAASVSAPAPAPAVPEISSVSLFRAMDPATTFAAPGAGRVAFYSIPAAVPAGVLPPRVGSKTLPSNNYRMVRSEKGIWIDVPPSEGIVGGPVNIKEFGVGDHNHLDMFGRGGHHAFAFKLPSGQIYEVPYDSAHAEVRKQIRVAIGREYVDFLRSEERAASVAAASASAAAGFVAPVRIVMNPDLSSTKIVSGAVEGITVPTMLDSSIKDDKLLERFKALPHREMRRAPGMRSTEVIYLAELSTPIDITVRASKAHVIGVRTDNGKFISYCYLDEFGNPINAVSPDNVAVKSTLVKEIGFAELDRLSNTMPSFVFGTMQAAVTINDSDDLKKRLEQKWMLEGGFSSKVKPHPKFVESDSPKDAEYLMMKISDVKVNFNLPKFPGRDSHISEIGIRTKNRGGVFGKKVFNYVVKTTNLAGEEIYYEIPLTDEKLNNLASATLSSLVVSAHQHTYSAPAPAPATSSAAPSLRAVSAAVRDIAVIDRREDRRLLEDELVSASFVRHREGVVEAAPGSVVSGAKAIPLSDYFHGYSVAKGTYRGDHDHENSDVMKAMAYAAIKVAADARILGTIANADNLIAVAAADWTAATIIGGGIRKECALQGIYSSNTSTLGQGLDIGEMPDLAKRAFNKLMANPDKVALAAEAKEFLRKNAERVREAAGKSR